MGEIISRLCRTCGKPIPEHRYPNAKYCGSKCRILAQHPEPEIPLSTGQTGAMSELRVCADLLSRGFNVFRAQSPACPCDLVVMKGDRLVRVEVRTRPITNGYFLAPTSAKDSGRFDVLAVVSHSGIIVYEPEVDVALEDSSKRFWNTHQHTDKVVIQVPSELALSVN